MIQTRIVDIGEVTTDPNNPRKDMGDLEAMAATFAANTERPGEPFTPPLVVRDGAHYRVVDGERRLRAMRAAGTGRLTVMVAEDMDEANTLLAMIATNDKLELTDEERDRGVQQMLILGVEPSLAAKAARIEAQKVYAAKSTLTSDKRPEGYETMTIDELAAEHDFPLIIQELTEAAKDLGIEVTESTVMLSSWHYCGSYLKTVDQLRSAVEKTIKKYKCSTDDLIAELNKGNTKYPWRIPHLDLYYVRQKGAAAAKTPEEQTLARLTNSNKKDRKARGQFIADHLMSCGSDLKHTAAFILENLPYPYTRDAERFTERYGLVPISPTASPMLIAYVCGGEGWDKVAFHKALGLSSGDYYSNNAAYERYLKMVAALIADGYEPSESEQEISSLLQEHLDNLPAGDGDEDENDDDPNEDDDDE